MLASSLGPYGTLGTVDLLLMLANGARNYCRRQRRLTWKPQFQPSSIEVTMALVPFWFIVIAVLWTGFFILEGFDFGVGTLHSVVGQDDARPPGALHQHDRAAVGRQRGLADRVRAPPCSAAFPGWYADHVFSGLYLVDACCC